MVPAVGEMYITITCIRVVSKNIYHKEIMVVMSMKG